MVPTKSPRDPPSAPGWLDIHRDHGSLQAPSELHAGTRNENAHTSNCSRFLTSSIGLWNVHTLYSTRRAADGSLDFSVTGVCAVVARRLVRKCRGVLFDCPFWIARMKPSLLTLPCWDSHFFLFHSDPPSYSLNNRLVALSGATYHCTPCWNQP